MKRKAIVLSSTAFAMLVFIATLSFWGCDLTGKPTLEKALVKAQALADAWDADNKLTGIVGFWLDDTGKLGDDNDKPGWGFNFVNADGSKGYGVFVFADGTTDAGEETVVFTEELTATYTTNDVVDHIKAAVDEIENHPNPLSGYDYVYLLGVPEDHGVPTSMVVFVEEDDQQHTYPDDFEIGAILQQMHAYVDVNAETGAILYTSWENELSLEWAQAKAAPLAKAWDSGAMLTGIVGYWLDSNAELSTDENSAWGFTYVNGAGTQAYGVFVTADGATDAGEESVTFTQKIRHYSNYSARVVMQTATGNVANHPNPLDDYEYTVLFGVDPDHAVATGMVVFVDGTTMSADLGHDFDVRDILKEMYGYVDINAETGAVLRKSWESTGSVEQAYHTALPLAQAWDSGAQLSGVVGHWIDQRGHLGDAADNPAWGFNFINAGGTQAYGIFVFADGTTSEGTEPVTYTVPLSYINNYDIGYVLGIALTEIESHPNPMSAYDYNILVAEDPLHLVETAMVVFLEAGDQGQVYPNDFDVNDILNDRHASISIDIDTGGVLANSWTGN